MRTFVEYRPGQSGSITFRLSVLANTSITPENFVYKPYKLNLTNGDILWKEI